MLLKNNKIIIISVILDLVFSVFNINTYFTILTCLLYKDSYIYLILLIYSLSFKGNILMLIPTISSVFIVKELMKKWAINSYTFLINSILTIGIFLIITRPNNLNIIGILLSIVVFNYFTYFYQKNHNKPHF